MEKGKRQIEALSNFATGQDTLKVPAYSLYGEDWTQSIFGFFHIEALSVRNVPNNWGIASHRHLDFDQMSVLFTGSSTFKHDGQQGAAKAPSCVYTPANVVHQFSYSPGSIGFVISFSSDFVAGLPAIDGAPNAAMLRLARNRVIALQTETQIAMVQGLVQLLAEKASSLHRHQRDYLRYLFGALLLEFDTALAQSPGRQSDHALAGDTDLFRRFRELIQSTIGMTGFTDHKRPLQALTVEAFAARLCVTRYSLNVACHSISGCPAREVIQTAILEQATRLLLYSTMPVKEISFLLGYSQASHFARFFKQRRGCTPDAFRQSFPSAA